MKDIDLNVWAAPSIAIGLGFVLCCVSLPIAFVVSLFTKDPVWLVLGTTTSTGILVLIAIVLKKKWPSRI